MSRLWDVESELQNANVFVSGIDGRNTHMDSYMTIIDFKQCDATLLEIKDKYSVAEWEYFVYNWYTSELPMCKLLAYQVTRVVLEKPHDRASMDQQKQAMKDKLKDKTMREIEEMLNGCSLRERI